MIESISNKKCVEVFVRPPVSQVNITNLVRYCYYALILLYCIDFLMSNLIESGQFIDVSNMKDVPVGKIKHVEAGEKEILLANNCVDGKVYALCDRCST